MMIRESKNLVMLFIFLCFPLASAEEMIYNEVPQKYPWNIIGDEEGDSLQINTSFSKNPQNGSICTEIIYDSSVEDWAGAFIQATGNARRGPGIGLDLAGKSRLEFFAKGEKGGEKVNFGYGYDEPGPDGGKDSASDRRTENLTDQWKKYTFNLTDKDLSHINGIFMFIVDADDNPKGATFYIDNIKYV